MPGIAESDEEPVARLRRWLWALFDAKRAKALDDPELFATYEVLVSEQADVVADHLDELVGQLERIVADGAVVGTFAAANPRRTARALFHALSRFHHPAYAAAWAAPGAVEDFEAVVDLVLDGLVRPA
ncbi:hypothetical protein [Actinomycetospora sp. CA-084318]|uniref:hypothetical protein n=1 Tax=Actinomycetospora sp. CA-084318 TaxID=3239892 RepID=UPI003D990A10